MAEGWESFQRMTKHKRGNLEEGNRLRAVIPDESSKSKTVGWAWCLKSQVTFSLAPTHPQLDSRIHTLHAPYSILP